MSSTGLAAGTSHTTGRTHRIRRFHHLVNPSANATSAQPMSLTTSRGKKTNRGAAHLLEHALFTFANAEVNELIRSELHEGKISDEKINSMLERHLDKYNRIENEAYEMYKLAEVLHKLRTKAGERRSPYELTASLTSQLVRERISQWSFNCS